MKKKHRDIVVNGKKYGWITYSGGKDHDIRIFFDKKVIHTCTVRLSRITPKLIAEIIKKNNL